MKTYGDAALAALASGKAIVTGAVAFYAEEPIRLWGGHGSWTIGEETFVGIGEKGIVRETGGAIGGTEQNITLSLSGIAPEAMALFDAAEIQNAPAALWRMIFDQSGTQMLDARVHRRGRVDQVLMDEDVGGASTITVQLEGAARGLGRRGGRMRSDADQRLIDPPDGFFKHVSYAAHKQVYFGGKRSASAGSGL